MPVPVPVHVRHESSLLTRAAQETSSASGHPLDTNTRVRRVASRTVGVGRRTLDILSVTIVHWARVG